MAGPANLRCACRTPVSTMPMPYSTTWGAKTSRKRAARATSASSPPISRNRAIGSANTAIATASGVRTSRVQPISADAVRRTCSVFPAAMPPASIGTTRLASAPPATTSKTMFGTVFAAW
jgi:hypothetical protein